MLFLLWYALCLVAACLMLLLPFFLRRFEIYRRYSGSRLVSCPENQKPAAVTIDARRAAATGIDGAPILRLCDCARWPERANCAQGCLPQAVRLEPYQEGQVTPEAKPIRHLPVVLAAFAAWCLGALWHAQYVFRAEWTAAVGLTESQVKQIVWRYSPHLLTAAVWLLFAYGVAWLLTVRHRCGVFQGIFMSLLLAAAVATAASYSIAKLPHDLLAVEAGYVVLAVLVVGTIVGGLYDRMSLPSE